MRIPAFPPYLKSRQVWLAVLAVLLIAVYELHYQGRLWWCACGQLRLWAGDIWSAENSQQLLDPYSFTHLLHGFIFYWLLKLILPRLAPKWQLWLAVTIEALWEVIENSALIIDSLLIFGLVEILLVFWIRDGLIFNIIMLLYPIDAIKQWQIGH